MTKVAVILLTYNRLSLLNNTINSLLGQTYKDFDIYISHGNNDNKDLFKRYMKRFQNSRINFSIDIDNKYCFRRYEIAKKIVKDYEIFFFLDDDVDIDKEYIKNCLSQYTPKSYQSSYAYSFVSNPPEYLKRKRYYQKNNHISYCGPGISMIDGSIFKNDDFFENPLIKDNYEFDDIWISYFTSKNNWSLNYLKSNTKLNGEDDVALYKQVLDKKNTFLQTLIKEGWNINIDLTK